MASSYEEENFNQTLDRGLDIFESVVERIGHASAFPGADAFKLYDTYGFPIDLTEMMAEERGLKVDLGEFTALMESQRERSRKGGGTQTFTADRPLDELSSSGLQKRFTGYEVLETRSTILLASGNRVVLDATPFYVESGGQVSDTGVLIVDGHSHAVTDTRKQDGAHVLTLEHDLVVSRGKEATAIVDRKRREGGRQAARGLAAGWTGARLATAADELYRLAMGRRAAFSQRC